MSIETPSQEQAHLEQNLEALLAKVPDDEGRALVRKAFEWAERLHTGQRRKSGELYIEHPLAVAALLSELNMDPATIAAGLLHDVLEDTEVTAADLSAVFPDPVTPLVQGVTKINRIHFDQDSKKGPRKEKDTEAQAQPAEPEEDENKKKKKEEQKKRDEQVENLRKIILAMAKDIRVIIIKLCDRLHNMRTLRYLPPNRRQAISRETLDIYAPLANRLGMVRFKSELEDLSMYWLYPGDYQTIARSVAKKKKERDSAVGRKIAFLSDYLGKNGYPHIELTGRSKHFYSIWRKLKNTDQTFDQIYDLSALRIICKNEAECYGILGLIHQLWAPIPGRIKDYIGMPKPNGYKSIHTTVVGLDGAVTEIQIRSESMHQVAELGIAAHWRYKENRPPQENDERLEWLRHLMEWVTDPGEPSSLIDALKRDVFADVVLCFTPDGDVVELPAGATPIDFAYAIHTKVGESCVGARANGRIISLPTALRHGDVVEIMTNSNGHPSRDWLDIAVTGRAKSKIRHWLKSKEMEKWVGAGRENLMRILKQRNFDVTKSELETELEKLLEPFRLQTLDDLYANIGFGDISAQAALSRANPEWTKARRPSKKKPKVPSNRLEDMIVVEGMEGLTTRIAACCKPIPGDPVVGYVTRGRGVTVHHGLCPNVNRIRAANESIRLIKAQWKSGDSREHNIIIRVVALDRPGLLAELSDRFSNQSVNIVACSSRTNKDKEQATLRFVADVENSSQLDKLLKALREVPGVAHAERRSRFGA